MKELVEWNLLKDIYLKENVFLVFTGMVCSYIFVLQVCAVKNIIYKECHLLA